MEYPLNQAMQSTLAVLTKVRPDDLNAPTPCASWDVRALVNHFIGTGRWWAARSSGDDGGADTDYAAGDFVAAYEESIAIALGAFAADGALERTGPAAVRRVPGGRRARGWPPWTSSPMAGIWRVPSGMPPTWTRRWPPHCSARPGSRSPTRSADLTGRRRSGPPSPVPDRAGPADQLAGFLGRSV